MSPEHNRDAAIALLHEYTESASLRGHALAVEAAMRWYAKAAGEDEELWGLTGLLHDFDYERFPTAPEHPSKGIEILRGLGWPDEMLEAIAGHAPYLGVPRVSSLAKTLFAVDELCGLITAVAYVRPSRKLADVESSSVRKKLKDKTFARSVSREDILIGCEELAIDLDLHISNCITAMKEVAKDLGL